MINFDGVDFSEHHFEEVISLSAQCISLNARRNKQKAVPLKQPD